MTPHPRLLAPSALLERLRKAPEHPLLWRAARVVAADAARYVKSRELTYNPHLHNALLDRAREMQRRVLTLLVRWLQTGEPRYRAAAVAHARDMGAWTHWSWEMAKNGNPDPNGDFDLSYGENSATLAIAYDWLHATLSEEERAMFVKIAMRWSIGPFLARTEKETRSWMSWWFGNPTSNWNTVCAGGAGMLALALMDEIPKEAAEVVKRADISIAPYMKSLTETAGGWVEGIGYWNYGHRYAFWYLLSNERATGKVHRLLELPGVAPTLDFPLDFCPHGRPCSFSDVNKWSPLPFFYAAAARLKRTELTGQIDKLIASEPPSAEGVWPKEAELLVFHPRFHPAKAARKRLVKRPVQKLYPKLKWGILADQMPEPNFYLSIRGGPTGWTVPHSQMDLLSFHCVVGGERLIDNIGINGGKEYLDTTFGQRRNELFEASAPSKNTILINGLGIADQSIVSPTRPEGEGWRAWGAHFILPRPPVAETTALAGSGWKGFRLDVSDAMNAPGDRSIHFCARLFLFLEGPCALIVDRVVLSNPGRMESRFHTYSRASFKADHAEIRGRKERLTLAFAASAPSRLHRAEDALTTPGPRSTMLRWCTDGRTHAEVTFATLLAPGAVAAAVGIESHPGCELVSAVIGGNRRRLNITKDLTEVSIQRGKV